MNARYWIGVASRDHVKTGVAGGFCQLGHGKSQPLKRMHEGDWLIYYSSKEAFKGDALCQSFTAIGQLLDERIYAVEMTPDFVAQRRDVRYLNATDTPIRALLESLSFIKDVKRWGYAFRFGHFEIQYADFVRVATAMLGHAPV